MDYRPIIEARYNRTSWQALINDIFGTAATLLQTAAPVEVNNELAREAFYLGRITLPDGYQIAIYEVRLNDHVLVERNRVGIRNLLLSHWRDNGYVGAFMFCYRENDAVLRFSYVSETWQFGDDGNYAKTSTDTKRYTYLLGEGHRSRTAVERFEKLKDSQLTLKDLTKAFSVEALSDKFFDEYKQCYENIVAYVTGKRMVKEGSKWVERTVGTPNTTIMQQFNQFPNAEKAVRDYVKKLMGRLVFIQFLQKKGWMGVPQGDGWENGDREFLQHLYEKSNYKDSFVDNVLEPLFDNINTLRQGDLVTNPNVGQGIKVPYLNGGLFEQDDYDRIDFPLPARFIKSVLDFFAAYNFTIDENDPDDAEVGVDPEMLGRVFENLLEDNKDKGAFYTPKEIVQYMCRESLVAYLQTGITDETTREAIRQFVTTHDAKHINGADSKLAQQVDRHLKDVKICDPAIGSGAFPMGLLRELYACRQAIEGISPEKAVEIKQHIIQQNIYGVDIEKGAVDIARLRFWLALIVDETTPAALPNLDFKIMQGNSLLEQYRGVDLSRVAAKESNITVVEPERDLWGNIEIKQLEINFQKTDTRKQLQELLEKYFYVSNHCDKQKLRNEIGNIIRAQIKASVDGLRKQCDRQLNELKGGEDCRKEEKKARELLTDKRGQYVEMLKELESIDFVNDQFFLWHTWFADVLNRPSPCNGFDIVIGNPPYVKEYENKSAFNGFRECSPYYMGKMDLWHGFACTSLDLLHSNGILSFIAQNNWGTNKGAELLREKVMEETSILQLVDFGDYMVFNGSASIQTMIMIFVKNAKDSLYTFDYRKLCKQNASKNEAMGILDKSQHEAEYHSPEIDRIQMKGVTLSFSNARVDKVLNHIKTGSKYLSEKEIAQGIVFPQDFLNKKGRDKLGFGNVGDGIFCLTNTEVLNLNLSPAELDLLAPFYTTKECKRYITNIHNRYMMIYTDSSYSDKDALNEYPHIKSHLDRYKPILTSSNKPYGLHRARNPFFFYGEKIVSQRKCVGHPSFSYSDFDVYVSQTFFVIKSPNYDMKFLTGLLNSKVVEFWLRNRGKMQGGNFQIDKEPLMRIPIKTTSEAEKSISKLVDDIIKTKKLDCEYDTLGIEHQIDRIVYDLYGLTEEEIKIVEGE